MNKLKRILSVLTAAVILTTSFSVQGMAQTNDTNQETAVQNISTDDFVMPEGIDDEPFIDINFSENDEVEKPIEERVVNLTPEKGESTVTEGIVSDTARFPEAAGDEFVDYEDRADSTLDGNIDAYYVPNYINETNTSYEPKTDITDSTLELIYANVYTAPADKDIQIDSVSFFMGDSENSNFIYSGSVNVYLFKLGDKNLNEVDFNEWYQSNYTNPYITSSGWYTMNLNNKARIRAGERYAVCVVTNPRSYYSYTIDNQQYLFRVPATKGSYGTDTSYAGYRAPYTNYNYDSSAGMYLTDLAKDGMRAALNVNISEWKSSSSYNTYLYVDDSCMYDEQAEFYVDGISDYLSLVKSSPALHWSKSSSDIDSYNLYRETLVNGNYSSKLIASTTATEFTDSSVTSGFYRYRINPVVDGVEQSVYDTVYIAYPTIAAPKLTLSSTNAENNQATYTVSNNVNNLAYYSIRTKYLLEDGTYTYSWSSANKLSNNTITRSTSPTTFNYWDGPKLATPVACRIVLSEMLDDNSTLYVTKPSENVVINATNNGTVTLPNKAVDIKLDVKNYTVKATIVNDEDYTGYYLFRKESTQNAYEYLSASITEDDMSYVDTDIIPGKTYYYAAVGIDDHNYFNEQNALKQTGLILGTKVKVAKIPTVSSPIKPTLQYVKDELNSDKDYTYFTLAWNKVTGADSYAVYAVPVLPNGKKGEFVKINTLNNFVKTSIAYTDYFTGYYFYIVPRSTHSDLNGTPAAAYFANKASVLYTNSSNGFWDCATDYGSYIGLYRRVYINDDYTVALFRYSGNDSMMRAVGHYTVDNSTSNYSYSDSLDIDSNTEYKYRGGYITPYDYYIYDGVATVERKYTVSTPDIISAEPLVNAVSLEWNPVAGATKYYVYSYYNGKYTAQGTTTDTNFTAKTALTNGVKYGFVVRASVNGKLTSFTTDDLVYATPVAHVAKPVVTKAVIKNTEIELSWNLVDNATKYAVYTYDPVTAKYALISANVTDTTYAFPNLTTGKKYGFLIRAYGVGKWSDYTTEDIYYATPKPQTPALTVKLNSTKGTVDVDWDNVYGATKYQVYTYLNGKYSLAATVNTSAYSFSNLTPSTKYGFLVRSYVDGKWSSYTTNDIAYYTTPAAVKPAVTVGVADKSLVLNFSGVSATKYMVFQYNKATGKYTTLATTTNSSYTVKNLVNGTEYGFLVRAYVNGAWTAFTADDVVYATPAKYTYTVDNFNNYYNSYYAYYYEDHAVKATKYAFYIVRDGKYYLDQIVEASEYTTTVSAKLKTVLPGEYFGILIRGYVNGQWTDYSADDIAYYTAATLNVYAYSTDSTQTKVLLRWSVQDNATRYAVYTYDYSTEKYTLHGTTAGNYYYIDNPDKLSNIGVLIRAYIDGAYTAFNSSSVKNVSVSDYHYKHYASVSGIDGGIAVYDYDNNSCLEYRVYLYQDGEYILQAETKGEPVFITGLTEGTYYKAYVTCKYDDLWIEPEYGSSSGANAGKSRSYSLYTGKSGTIEVDFYHISSEIYKKLALYTYDKETGKYTLINNNISPDTDKYLLTGLTNGKEYGILVRAYVNGKWSSFTEDDIKYATPEFEKPYFYLSHDDGSLNVSVEIYDDAEPGYKKFYIYSYNYDTAKYSLLKTIDANGSYDYITETLTFTEDPSYTYGILVRASNGTETTAFTSDDVRTIY